MATMYPIGKLFSIEKGTLQSSKCTEGKYNFITAAGEWKTHNEYSHDGEALIFAAAASGSLGRTHYVNGKFTASDLCYILTPKDKKNFPLNLTFYHFLFNSIREVIVKETKTGTSKESINRTNFSNYLIPYFDIKKQLQWSLRAKEVDEIQNEFATELTHQQTYLTQLRQAILQDAVMGKLSVAETGKKEDAKELLAQIKAEKQKLIAAGKLKKEKPLPPITEDEIPFVLPKGWVWCRLGEISVFLNGDRGKNYPNVSEYVDEGVAWINTGHIEPDGTLTTTTMNYITRPKYNSLRSGKIIPGDLVYCLRGATMGKTAFVEPYTEGAVASSLMIIRLTESINKRYLYYYLKSPMARLQLLRFDNGSAQPNLSAGSVGLYTFPLPPLSEQQRIVTKVEQLMQQCSWLEQTIQQSQQQAKQLLQAVLREAFEVKPKEYKLPEESLSLAAEE